MALVGVSSHSSCAKVAKYCVKGFVFCVSGIPATGGLGTHWHWHSQEREERETLQISANRVDNTGYVFQAPSHTRVRVGVGCYSN